MSEPAPSNRPATVPPGSDRVTALVDRLCADVVLRYATGRRVLDLGQGAPAVTEWVKPRVARLVTIDAAALHRDPTSPLPFPDASCDCIYSLRTLPHLGHDGPSSEAALHSILHQIARMLVPDGVAIVQLANARGPRGLMHGLRHRERQSTGSPLVVDSPQGLTRFDVLPRVIEQLPDALVPCGLHGLPIPIASARLLTIPILGRLLTDIEWWARDQPFLLGLAPHWLVVVRRLTPTHPPQ